MDQAILSEWFRRRSLLSPDQSALSFNESHWTFLELQKDIEHFANLLAAEGVTKGDRVAYLGFNHPMFLVALFATSRLGAIFVPLNFRLTGAENAHMISDAGARTIIAAESHVENIDDIRDQIPCQRYLVLGPERAGWSSIPDLLNKPHAPVPAVDTDPDSAACIIYTSGTTGKPKGATLSHRNLWTNNMNWMLAVNYNASDVSLTTAPLFHSGGLCVITLPTLMAGGHIILQESFDPGGFIKAIEDHRVTAAFCVPAMMLFASQHDSFNNANLSTVNKIIVGGAPVPEPMLKLYQARGIPVSQCWGQTETSTGATFLSTDKALKKLGSCGLAGMLCEVKLIDFQGNTLRDANTPGELCVKGNTVMLGYWNMPEANAKAFIDDGWLRTGDVAYRDDDGYYYVCDRLKDMIISGGENIYPAEIEGVLYDHPNIAEVAVIGAPDERWGERVVAVVALKAGTSLTLEELQAFGEQQLGRYKLPRELRIVEALPRNSTGKVQKAILRSES
jgi:fatty-acyl-CoA synthase